MAQGQQNTYVGTVPQKRVVSDRIFMTDPMEIALVKALGMDADSKFKFVNAPGAKYEWLVDTYSPQTDTVSSGLASDSTTTTFTATDGTLYHVGDVILVELEYMWVSAISSNTITVTRNQAGTQATHANSSTVYIHSNARLEGADASDSHFTQPTSMYNYSQIFHENIEISRSDSRIQRYGIPDLTKMEQEKKMDQLKIKLTKLPYHGIRAAGSATTPRMAGGLDTFINSSNKTDLSSTALTLKSVEDMVQTVWNAGGRPSLLVCGGFNKRKIVSWFEGAVRTERSETLGGVTIDKIQTAMGPQLDVLVDRYCPASKVYILTPDLISYVTIDEFFYEDLGKVGDTEAYGQVIGEYGFAMANDTHHGLIYGTTTS